MSKFSSPFLAKSPLNQNRDRTKDSIFTKYMDLNDDGDVSWWEYGAEALSWAPTAVAFMGGTASTGVGGAPAAVATKVGVKQLLKKGVQWLGKNPKKTLGFTVGGKTVSQGTKNQINKTENKKGHVGPVVKDSFSDLK